MKSMSEVDFLIDLVVDFEKTTDPEKIHKTLKTTMRTSDITIQQIEMVIKLRMYNQSKELTSPDFFKKKTV